MPDDVIGTTVSEVTVPVTAPITESSADLKAQLTKESTPVVPKSEKVENVKNKSPQHKPDARNSEQIRQQIIASSGVSKREAGSGEKGKTDGVNAPEKTEIEDKSKWFDPDKGFRTPEDMKKSYGELQQKLTKTAEEVKVERSRLELEQAQIKAEVEKIKQVQSQRPLTPEETQKQEAVKQWKTQNKDALDLIKQTLKEDLDAESQQTKQNEVNSSIHNQILKERQDWLDSFNKDAGRKQLWNTMEQVFKEKGDTAESAVKDFAKNPLPYMEALAFHKNFSTIAEQIKAEAVQQYVSKQKEAAEVERKSKFALPGGPKAGTGDVDVSKLSSSEIGSFLSRNENG